MSCAPATATGGSKTCTLGAVAGRDSPTHDTATRGNEIGARCDYSLFGKVVSLVIRMLGNDAA